MITRETRAESLNETDKTKRYTEIRDALKDAPKGLTARELADKLGYKERNATAPRCTELVNKGELEVIGKRYDPITNRNVAVYVLKDKKLDLGYSMKCENCNKGYIKREKGRIKEVFCGKLMSNMAISYYKQMRVCNLFEKR